MSGYRQPAAVVPEYLREPKWHERAICRAIGHSWREVFDHGGEPFPAYCQRCLKTDAAGRTVDDYYDALDRWKRWLDRYSGSEV